MSRHTSSAPSHTSSIQPVGHGGVGGAPSSAFAKSAFAKPTSCSCGKPSFRLGAMPLRSGSLRSTTGISQSRLATACLSGGQCTPCGDRQRGAMQENILQSIGRTPLVRLRRVAEGLPPSVYLKVESHNPGGSVKDRVGLAMIAEAERHGWLRPGGRIIEATAGNTGVGLAMAAAVKGYRCIFVLPDKMSSEKIRLLKAYGAEIVITPTNVAPDSPESYNGVADRLGREIPRAGPPNQFTNPANPEIHYRTTGPEIWEQTEGRITAFVAGVGTGGTISGVARYLKERNPDIKIIGADPEGSVLSGGSPRPWKVEGIGEDFVPKTFNSQLVDDWVRVGDAESFHVARSVARREGILLGGSSGTAIAAALRYAQRLTAEHVVVALAADTGRNYLSKMYNDEWLNANNLNYTVQPQQSVGDL